MFLGLCTEGGTITLCLPVPPVLLHDSAARPWAMSRVSA